MPNSIAAALVALLFGYNLVAFLRWQARRRRECARLGDWLAAGGLLEHPEFLAAFDSVDGQVRNLGRLALQSGEIVVCDPAYLSEEGPPADPFDEKILVGEWPVDALWVKGRVAGLRLTWDKSPVAALRPCYTALDRAGAATRIELPSFPVDSAHACLTTTEGRMWSDAIADFESATGVLLKDGANLFVCPSGYGDGLFPCYFGLDADGRAVALFVDFKLLGESRRVWGNAG